MSSSININVPATITAIAGQPSLSSLIGLPTSLVVTDSAAGAAISLKLVTGDSAATLSANASGGAAVVSSGNTLQISGSTAQVNAALATLSFTEPSGITSDKISLSATDNKGAAAQSDFALSIVPQTAPAFVAPTKLVTLSPNQPLALPDLLLSDPTASALAAMGLGAEETLQLTLAVSAGALLLPDYSALTGISADGIGTGTIHLTLSANDIGALNTLLTSLEFAGPSLASGQHLTYDLWNHDGVLPRAVTSGNIYLNTVGAPASTATYAQGAQTLVTGIDTLSGTLDVSGTLSALGNLVGNGAVSIAPGAVLELPYNSALLGGTSYDFGTIATQDIVESGQLLIGGTASLQGELVLNTNALVDFASGLTVDTGAANDFQEELTLASGAILEGNGTLSVGDFSASGMIDGTGTILALQGETLEIDAGMVSSGVNLDVAGGGVMVLGPVTPLVGIFNTTPLTVQSGVTLNFGGPGSLPVTGGYANPLGGNGGAFVISGPEAFSGTVSGFAVGDELVFPGLTGLVVHNISTISGASSFVVSGVDSNGTTQSYTIFSNIPAGLLPAASFDAAGDATVVLHSNIATVTSNGGIAATAGVAQPLLGISVALAAATTQSLTITLSSAHGSLSASGGSASSALTLTASNLSSLNAEIASVSYTGTGALDVLTISSGTGILAGLQSLIAIDRGGSGTVNGYSGLGFTEAELVSFGSTGGLYVDTTAHALGGVLATGQIEFNDELIASGFSGTALQIDNGGNVILGAAASAALAGDVVIGDTNGAGALEVLTNSASISGNLTLTAAGAGAGSSLAVVSALNLSGAALLGVSGAAVLDESGTFTAGSLSLGTFGTLQSYGAASGNLGGVNNSGTIGITGFATIAAASYIGTGGLTLGGAAELNITGAASFQAGQGFIGTDARLTAATFTQTGGTLTIDGRLAATGAGTFSNVSLAGGGSFPQPCWMSPAQLRAMVSSMPPPCLAPAQFWPKAASCSWQAAVSPVLARWKSPPVPRWNSPAPISPARRLVSPAPPPFWLWTTQPPTCRASLACRASMRWIWWASPPISSALQVIPSRSSTKGASRKPLRLPPAAPRFPALPSPRMAAAARSLPWVASCPVTRVAPASSRRKATGRWKPSALATPSSTLPGNAARCAGSAGARWISGPVPPNPPGQSSFCPARLAPANRSKRCGFRPCIASMRRGCSSRSFISSTASPFCTTKLLQP